MHARPRRHPLTRGSTLLTMLAVVSVLAVLALTHAPHRAVASSTPPPPQTAPAPATSVSDSLPTAERLGPVLMAHRRAALLDRKHAAQRLHERRAARREARQERRAQARAAARAAARARQWTLPVPGAGWSASFGEPGSAWSSGYHTGQDFTAPSGTPVLAAGPGTITSATWSDAYGNVLVITHPGGAQSWYAHLTAFERTSGSVDAGDVVGYVGCTGNCYGSHLHFEYRPGGGEPADPLPWLREHGAY